MSFRLLATGDSVVLLFAPEGIIKSCSDLLVSRDIGAVLSSGCASPLFAHGKLGQSHLPKLPAASVIVSCIGRFVLLAFSLVDVMFLNDVSVGSYKLEFSRLSLLMMGLRVTRNFPPFLLAVLELFLVYRSCLLVKQPITFWRAIKMENLCLLTEKVLQPLTRWNLPRLSC